MTTADSNTPLVSSDRETALPWAVLPPEITHGPGIPRLYRRPPKIRGESLESWILRIAERYGWTPAEIAKYFYPGDCTGLDFRLRQDRIRRIAMVTASHPSLIASRLELGLLRLKPIHCWALAFHANGSVRRRRVCALCLREDETPYFRLTWQLATTVLCDHHDVPLIEFCPTCSSPINWKIEARIVVSPQSQGDFLRHCPACRRRLDRGALPRRVPDRLGQMLKGFQRLVLQVIGHGLHHHPVYGSLTREEFFEMFLTQQQPTLVTRGKGSKSSMTRHARSWVDWRRVVHPRDYSTLLRWFRRRLEP